MLQALLISDMAEVANDMAEVAKQEIRLDHMFGTGQLLILNTASELACLFMSKLTHETVHSPTQSDLTICLTAWQYWEGLSRWSGLETAAGNLLKC